jgi:TolB-like protein/Flp pilus assembly protein TadD
MSNPLPVFYEFGPFRLDTQRCLVLREGVPMNLSPKAFETLLVLVENNGRVMKKEDLMARIWANSFVEEGNLTQNIFILRKALGEGPNDHRYIVTVPGQGYRFVASVKTAPLEESASRAWTSPRSESTASNDAVASIAVLPFKTLGENGHELYLGPGLADALITKLSGIAKIAVRPTTAILKYTGAERDTLAAGRELGVDTVLDGHVQRLDERIRVTVQLVRLRDGKTLWAEKFDEKFTDVFAVQDSISEQVTRALMLKLTAEEQEQLSKRYTENTEAFQVYIKGRYFWNKRTVEGLNKGIEYALQAISIDPTYAMAYVGLADCYNLLAGHGGLAPKETFPQAKAAALKALEIDPSLAQAYASLGFVSYRFDWDWPRAEHYFKRAVELSPSYSTAHHWYGESLAVTGRFEESIAALSRARDLDTLSLPINTDLAQSLYFARRFDESDEQLRKTFEMDQNFARACVISGAVYEQMGRHEEAVAVLQRAVELSEGNSLALSGLGHALALSGKWDEARRILIDLKELSRQRYISAYNIAIIHAGLGEKDAALDWLVKAYHNRDVWLVWLKVNPRFDTLRAEPRFTDLLRRIGLVA